MQYLSHSPEETEEFGIQYAAQLRPGDVVALEGALGAGKTAFVRGVLRGLGYQGRVTSPTFAIANEYEACRIPAVLELGFMEYLDGRRVLLIEWSENLREMRPEQMKTVRISYGREPEERTLEMVENL